MANQLSAQEMQRIEARAVAVTALMPTGRPWTDADHDAFKATSDKWDAEHPAKEAR
jgi:hypothetical protein